MRRVTLLVIPAVALLSACSESTMPNGQLRFTSGSETTPFDDIDHFTVERIDSSGKSKELLKETDLPTTLDMGSSGTYRFRATGFDAEENPLARGETLEQDVSSMLGLDIPIFLSRTDRTTIAEGNFTTAPGEYPKVGLVGSSALWLWANPSSDHITTDGYNYAYWQRILPQGNSVNYSEIQCPVTPCEWQTLVMSGGFVAIAISSEWAIWVDEYAEDSGTYKLPTGLDSFGDVAGGRSMAGADATAVLVGGARVGTPTAYNLVFNSHGQSTVSMLTTPRAGAATLFEVNVGLVVVGGSAEGQGLERIPPGKDAFVAGNYPADPVTGAALVREDEKHVLRVGGKNADGSPAETQRLDVTCDLELCTPEPLTDQAVAVTNARSFWDSESGDSIIVGEDEAGLATVYRYSALSKVFLPIEVPANQQRYHATAIELPNRKVALIGGMDPAKPTSSRSMISVVSF